ncbi:PREDICTED: collagen alpha-1(I) chain-like [Capra hircus]|uniref:collagen alpha-1(I) chain-like n=1 Tax=Capra hircus TaxID=9925 RepID=UPI000847CF11|nr:PREDICTED: collagen alpha-1(I) chain-like [Capra hircus]
MWRKVEKNFEERVQEGVKPLRGKRVGSAQSARRIQPGGGPGRAGGPADLSRSPCLPTPPPALPPPLAALPVRLRAGGGRRRGGRGGGRAGPGVGPAGDRPPAGDRAPPGAFPPRRCAATGSGTAGKARRGRWLGGPALPGCYSPAGSSARRIPGPREPALVAALSPLPALPPPAGVPLPRGGVPRGGARRGLFPGGRAAPPTARPLSRPGPPPPPFAGAGVGSGRGGLSPVRPGRVAPSGPGGRVSGRTAGTPSERTGSAAMSATHPTRLETRTKESNTCASQGLARKPPWRNEGEGRPQPAAEVGSRGLSQSAEGAPPARLARRAGEVEHERTC